MATNEMDAKLISQAEQISDLSATDLVTVSRGSGQPSLNIAFGDLVNAVATVMNTNQMFPFMLQGNITPSDFDSIVEPGYYKVTGTSGSDVILDWGTLIVYPSFSSYIIQIKMAKNVHEGVAKRVKTDSGWSNWSRLDNFGYNTLADLASGVAGFLPYIKPNNTYTDGDFNDMDSNGIYILTGASAQFQNAPGSSSVEGILLVFKVDNLFMSQIYLQSPQSEVYYRSRYESWGSWNSWVKL